jgi:hypothetical protein
MYMNTSFLDLESMKTVEYNSDAQG